MITLRLVWVGEDGKDITSIDAGVAARGTLTDEELHALVQGPGGAGVVSAVCMVLGLRRTSAQDRQVLPESLS